MSETREQFRERIRQVYWTAWNGGMPFYDQHTTERAERSQRDGAEAVYAQALRDVISHLDDQYICIGIERPAGNVHTAIDVVESFAVERGIEIGGEQ